MSAACPSATPFRAPDNLTGGAGPKERSPQRVPLARALLTSCSARAAREGEADEGGMRDGAADDGAARVGTASEGALMGVGAALAVTVAGRGADSAWREARTNQVSRPRR